MTGKELAYLTALVKHGCPRTVTQEQLEQIAEELYAKDPEDWEMRAKEVTNYN